MLLRLWRRNLADDIQTIFTALQGAQKGSTEKQKLRCIVWRASYRKILKRSKKDEKFFKKRIDVLLGGWIPEPGEILSPEYFEIDRGLDDDFQSWKIPHLPGKGERHKYLLSNETVRKWVLLLVTHIEGFSTTGSKWKELPKGERFNDPALGSPVYAYDILYRLLYRTGKALDAIFTQTSLGRHLLNHSKLKAESEELDPQLLQSISEWSQLIAISIV
jgi:hypothetical protein